jgi:hypothetical protein
MPHLIRLRIVSAGHPAARMEDITFDFTDSDGRPVDSVIWLRNGGGKSSILNLFFATLRPDKSDFLGAKAESKQRRLDHYILDQAPAVVACEWALDAPSDSLFTDTRRHLTGVFYERQTSRDDGESPLRRLYFGGPVADEDPRLSIDGLPLRATDITGRPLRRTLSAFRQEWTDLRTAFPAFQIFSTSIQREWAEYLEGLGIDPELFYYQIQMNLREGGAKEMFHFRESEDFADFLLKMVMDPDHAMQVSKNIRDFRERLYLRRDQLLPEADLTEGLMARLDPLTEIARERRTRLAELADAGRRLDALDGFIAGRRETLEAEKTDLTRKADAAAAEAESHGAEADRLRRRSAALARWAARERLKAAEHQHQETLETRRAAERAHLLWRAADPYAAMRRYEAEAEAYRAELQRKAETHAPLREDLTAAARAYHAALSQRIRDHRDAQDRENAAAEAARKAAADHRERAGDLAVSAAGAEKEAEHRRRELARAKEERRRLKENGVLLADETGEAAVSRLRAALEAGRVDLNRTRQALAEIREKRDRLQADARILEGRRTDLIHEKDLLERDLNAALAEKKALEARPAWTEVLELAPEAADLNRLTGEGLAALEAELHRLFQRLVALRIERSENERFRDHLGRHGLLPPSPDAETVLQLLQSRLPAAWSGWTYISENAHDNAARRRMVAAHPELAAGVVVRSGDFDAAVDILTASPPPLRTPVSVAPAEALMAPGEKRRHVVGPETDAYFDTAAGEAELVRIESRSTELDQRIADLDARHAALRDDRLSLVRFRETHPPAWFEARTAAVSEKTAAVAETDAALTEIQTALKAAEGDIRDGEERIEGIQADNHQAERRLDEAARFRDRTEQYLPTLREELTRFEASARSDREAAEGEKRAAETADADSRERDRKAMAHGADAGAAERDRDAVEYLDGPAPEAEAGDVRALSDAYARLKRQYESEVGEAGLQGMIERSRREAAAARKSMRKILQAAPPGESPMTEAEVGDAVAALPSPDAIEEERSAADAAEKAAITQAASAEGAVREAEAALNRREAACREMGDVPEPGPDEMPADPAAAKSEAEELAASAEKAQSRSEAARRTADEARTAIQQRIAALDGLEKDASRLAGLRKSYADLLGQATPDAATGETAEADLMDADVFDRVEDLSETLRILRNRFARLDRRRDEAVGQVQSFAREERFSAIRHSVGRRFREVAADHLETEIDGWMEKLEVRLATIRDDLKSIDGHRDILIRQLLQIAEEGLALLNRAASRSVLPEDLPTLGGKRFMTVATRAPESQEEKRGRMADLMERFLEEGTIPVGVDLVQRAVRQLARRMRIRILHPDPDHYVRNIEIPELARLSGGEQLTGAVLLFCTLAKLRARQRGKRADRSSVLLLDNPIGHASRVRFLTLQQTIARVMGVQLLFTTGINDPESLAVFPNIIRLKNERVDRKTGHRMIEADETADAEGRIEGVRLVRDAADTADPKG